jgi:hypothetical protein
MLNRSNVALRGCLHKFGRDVILSLFVGVLSPSSQKIGMAISRFSPITVHSSYVI